MEGIIVVDKPCGFTSHDVVALVRRKLKIRRVGHAGTLDPLATGVLVILVGKATRLFEKFVAFDKAYQATMRLGTKTHTADIQGNVIAQKPFTGVTRGAVEEAFGKLIGSTEQTPPMVSAIKYRGERLYKLARKGINVDRPARKIRIDALTVLDFDLPHVRFYLECSKGTYVRQIAEDVGESLGCGACITEIRRTKVGPFALEGSIKLEELNENHLRDWPAR
jgi:tRNA pseudouridine55 synthase